MATDIGTLITRSPGIRGGRPCIAGTGVSVRRIAVMSQKGLNPEEIAAQFGHLTLAQVYAALTYYHLNQEEIDADLASEEEALRTLERERGILDADEVEAETSPPAASAEHALRLLGAWQDIDADDALEQLDRIRHQSSPTPPFDL